MRNNRNNRKNSIKKERVIMITSAALVLAALTMTGIYMKNQSAENQNDGYTLDFSTLENRNENEAGDNAQRDTKNNTTNIKESTAESDNQRTALDDDLDYDPVNEVAEVDSGNVKNPKPTSGEDTESNTSNPSAEDSVMNDSAEQTPPEEEMEAEGAEEAEEANETSADHVETRTLSFSGNLIRPASGEVLIPYSMDSSVYFATLDQYKYNSAVVLGAVEGDPVRVCAEAKVISVFSDSELGNGVTLELGDGYQVTYGQLRDIQIYEGAYINEGEVLGFVNAPTKYYSVEGSNVYFRLSKDGAPVNPEDYFRQ